MAVRDRRWYVSLDALKNELGITATTHDAKLKRYIERASAYVERVTGRTFHPVTATRYFDAPVGTPRGALYLGDDLLSVTSITDDGGALTATSYFLYPLNRPPYRRVELLATSDTWTFTDSRQQAIIIVGTWGYSASYDDTGATLNSALSSTTAATFTASDGSLIEVGWSLLIDSEQLFVTGVSSNTVTVQRGNNGTTAATHSTGATIYRYVPEPDVTEAVVLLAALWYQWRDVGGIQSQRIGDYAVTYVDGWPVPEIVRDTLARLTPLV